MHFIIYTFSEEYYNEQLNIIKDVSIKQRIFQPFFVCYPGHRALTKMKVDILKYRTSEHP